MKQQSSTTLKTKRLSGTRNKSINKHSSRNQLMSISNKENVSALTASHLPKLYANTITPGHQLGKDADYNEPKLGLFKWLHILGSKK